jgi:hypothetical protein
MRQEEGMKLHCLELQPMQATVSYRQIKCQYALRELFYRADNHIFTVEYRFFFFRVVVSVTKDMLTHNIYLHMLYSADVWYVILSCKYCMCKQPYFLKVPFFWGVIFCCWASNSKCFEGS